MRGWVGVIITIACLTAAGVIFVKTSKNKESGREEMRKQLQHYFFCEECSEEFVGEGGKPQAECPRCELPSTIIRIKKRCNKCKTVFVQFEVDTQTNCPRHPGRGWNPRMNTNVPCPKCGGLDLMGITAADE